MVKLTLLQRLLIITTIYINNINIYMYIYNTTTYQVYGTYCF